MRTFIDLTGQRLANGEVEVLHRVLNPSHNTSTQAVWKCRCSCGNVFTIGGQAARRLKTGCRQCFAERSRIVGAALSFLFAQRRSDARRYGREFMLSVPEFKSLIVQNCAYCGIEPQHVIRTAHDVLLYNGIDRIDSRLGYVAGNCTPCCKICNYAKHNKTREEFLEWLKRAYEHNYGRNHQTAICWR
jgi:hypothetical protein